MRLASTWPRPTAQLSPGPIACLWVQPWEGKLIALLNQVLPKWPRILKPSGEWDSVHNSANLWFRSLTWTSWHLQEDLQVIYPNQVDEPGVKASGWSEPNPLGPQVLHMTCTHLQLFAAHRFYSSTHLSNTNERPMTRASRPCDGVVPARRVTREPASRLSWWHKRYCRPGQGECPGPLHLEYS
jgi:hypothetical protein